MAIKIQSTEDIEINAVKCVVYGGAGVGKTRLCATAPTPIIISAEKGLLSLVDEKVAFIEVKNLKEFDECYRWAKSSAEANDYETIGLDSLSEIAEVLVDELKPNFKDARQAYAALADSMMPMLRKFRDLPNKHTIFSAKLVRIQDEESDLVTEEILMPGRVIGNQLPYMIDELFCLRVDRKQKSFLQTRPDRMRFCKDRSGALDDPEVCNLTVIFDKIMSKRKH